MEGQGNDSRGTAGGRSLRGIFAVCLLLAVGVLSGCVHPGATSRQEDHYTLSAPKGTGPFPAVVVMHGCSGISRNMTRWAERLNRWGYVALVVDSFGPRGVTNVCKSGRTVDPDGARTANAFAAAAHLRGLPMVDPERVAVIGFSHGGWTVMNVAQRHTPEIFAAKPFRAAVAYYPVCFPFTHANVGIPLLILIGEKDDWTPSARCQELAARLHRPELVDLILYPNAYHGFDAQAPSRDYLGHHMEYDRAGAEDSFARTRKFLDAHLR